MAKLTYFTGIVVIPPVDAWPPIQANAIAPALIETEMVRNNPRATPALIPVGRFGTGDEVADMVVMLAVNGYVTGQTINVNGRWYMS